MNKSIETTITYCAPHGGKDWWHTTRVFTPITDQEWRENRWPKLVNDHLARYQADVGATKCGVDQMLYYDETGKHLNVDEPFILWLIQESENAETLA